MPGTDVPAAGQITLGQDADQSTFWGDGVLMPLEQEPTQVQSRSKMNPKHTSIPKFEFINALGPPKKVLGDHVTRKLVRVHAMRSFLREKESASAPGPPKPQIGAPEADSWKASAGKFKLPTWSRKSSHKSTVAMQEALQKGARKTSSLLAKELGPINVFPITLSPHIQQLLYHYHHEFTQNSLAVNPEGSWYSFAVTDAGLLHATLSLVALHYDLGHHMEVSFETTYQQSEAIRLVNERLSDPEAQLTDALIGSVAILTNFETMNGTAESAAIHMNGLERMTVLRGGLQGLGKNRVLQRVLTWADFCYSTTWDCGPRFPVLSQSTASLGMSIHFVATSANEPMQPRFSDLSEVAWDMVEILETLHLISTAICSSQITNIDRKFISNSIYLVEHQLISLRQDSVVSRSIIDLDIDLSGSLQYASHLYLHLAIRELPGSAKMHTRLLNQLKNTLPTNLDYLIAVAPNSSLRLLLWILFIGAAASRGKGEQTCFVTNLRQVSLALQIYGHKDFEWSLKGVLWLDGFCNSHCTTLSPEIFSL